MAHDVFISYSSEDKAVADAVCATLEGRKIRCWIAPRDVLPGIAYAEALIDGITRSRLIVLVFSKNSNKSQQVMREVERAVNKGIPIIPFRIEDVTPSKAMEYFLSAPHWLDALSPPIEKHLQKLADTVEVLLGTETPLKVETEARPKIKESPAQKRNAKPVYIVAGIVVLALVAFGVMYLGGIFKGDTGGELIGNSPSAIPGGGTQTISPTMTGAGPGGSALPGQTASPLSTSTSPITSTTSPATQQPTPTITTATSVINTSGQLTSGASTKGVLKKGETQWYYFSADEGDATFAVLSEGDSDTAMEPLLELLGPDGNVIAGGWGDVTYAISRAITKTGKHTLRVRDNANTGGNYVLSFMQLSKSVNPLTSGVSLLGQLKVPGDVNWYTFDANTGDAVYTVLSEGQDAAAMAPLLALLGPDGNAIAGGWGYVTYAIDRAITISGKHTLRIRDEANKGGNYVLSFMQLSKSVNPLTSGVSLQGELKVPGDVNWYTFDANANDAIFAVLSEGENEAAMEPLLELFGPDGKAIASGWGDVTYAISSAITKTGKHTLRIRDNTNTGGKYVLSFMQLSRSVNPLNSGASLQGQLKVPGDVNWYTFDAKAGDAVSAILSEGDNSESMAPLLSLFGPDGKAIASGWGYVTYAIDKAITITGKHTLRIRDEANKGGNYVLSFSLVTK